MNWEARSRLTTRRNDSVSNITQIDPYGKEAYTGEYTIEFKHDVSGRWNLLADLTGSNLLVAQGMEPYLLETVDNVFIQFWHRAGYANKWACGGAFRDVAQSDSGHNSDSAAANAPTPPPPSVSSTEPNAVAAGKGLSTVVGDAASENHGINAAELNRQGGILLGQGQLEDAIALFTRAIALDPRMTGAITNRGYALLRQNRLDEAEASAANALDVSSTPRIRASAKVLLGKIEEARGKPKEARTRYEEALHEQRGYPQAREALDALRLSGDDGGSERTETPATKPETKAKPFVDPFGEPTQAKEKRWVDPFGP